MRRTLLAVLAVALVLAAGVARGGGGGGGPEAKALDPGGEWLAPAESKGHADRKGKGSSVSTFRLEIAY